MRTSSGRSSEPVGEDVALDPAQDAERRQPFVRRGDLLALTTHVAGVEARHDAHATRVIADREVLVSECDRGFRHLEHRRLPVRPRRVHVQIASDRFAFDERRCRPNVGLLAELGRQERQTERGIDALLVRGDRQLPERCEVLRAPRRVEQRRPQFARRRDDELDRYAVDGHAERACRVTLGDRHDLGQLAEPRDGALGVVAGHDHGEPVREVAPSPRVSGRVAAEALRDRLGELEGAIQGQPAARLEPRALERGQDLGFGRRADPGDLPETAAGGRVAQLVGVRHVQRVPDLHEPLRREADEAGQPNELGANGCLQLVELREPPGLDELAEARLDRAADSGQFPDATTAHEAGDIRRRRADQLGGAPVRAHAVEARARQVEQGGERLEPVGEPRVVGLGHPGSVLDAWPRSSSRSAAPTRSSASPSTIRPVARSATRCSRT
jgi:hypothetical protein